VEKGHKPQFFSVDFFIDCIYQSLRVCLLFLCACVHACMCVCMCVCMCACMHACMHAHMHACTHACMHACMHAHMHARHTCMHAHMHACMHTCMHACMCVNCPPASNNGTSNQCSCSAERSSIRGHITAMAMMQDLAACPSGKLGSTSSPAAPRVPPGFAPK